MEFYDRIKELVKKSGKTMQKAIEEAGINYDSYNSLKRYDNLPRADDCVKLAKYLGVTSEYLVTGEDSTLDSDVLEVVKTYQKIPKGLRSVFKSVMEGFIKADDPGEPWLEASLNPDDIPEDYHPTDTEST